MSDHTLAAAEPSTEKVEAPLEITAEAAGPKSAAAADDLAAGGAPSEGSAAEAAAPAAAPQGTAEIPEASSATEESGDADAAEGAAQTPEASVPTEETRDTDAAEGAPQTPEASAATEESGDADAAADSAGEAEESERAAEPQAAGAKAAPARRTPEPEPVRELRRAMEADEPVKGKVIGWNNGGFHVVVGGMTAFCPRSEIEIDAPKAPKSYLDREMVFRVLKVERGGKRIVLSRSAHLKNERRLAREKVKSELRPGTVTSGRVASITDFGAFVELGGVQGLVHISELSRRRVEHPREVVETGQEVEVKILRVESGGRRISLSMKSLEPDPWEGIEKRFEEGSLVTGTVERTANFGAFINLAPGLTGLLPTSAMQLPRGASAARRFSPGKEVAVMIQSVDRRRKRISLSLEGSATEGSRKDFDSYRRQQDGGGGGFNALAAALEKARRDDT